ncbi:MAG: ImmA/IrrE family metallo-endopeptidase [Pseudomonadota bacterium]
MNSPLKYVESRTRAQIEHSAGLFRKLLGLNGHDRIEMLPVLEIALPEIYESDVLLIEDDKDLPGVEGITSLTEPIIQLPNSVYRQLMRGDRRARFTAAHELGHLLLHCKQPVHFARHKRADWKTDPEWQANTFAAALLMPEKGVRRCKSIEEITKKFGVSYEAAKCRAKVLKMNLTYKKTKKKGTYAKRKSP